MEMNIIDGEKVVTGKCGLMTEYTIKNNKMTIRYTGGSESGGLMRADGLWAYNSESNRLEAAPWKKYGVKFKELEIIGVSVIFEGAFASTDIEKVTIRGYVDTIGPCAFAWCRNLKTVEIEHGVRYISSKAFYRCTDLTYINLSDVKKIGNEAFYDCRNMFTGQKLSLPRTELINKEAFWNTGVTDVTFGNLISDIGQWAFGECKKLKTVTFPEKRKLKIEDRAFGMCKALKEVNIGGVKISVYHNKE